MDHHEVPEVIASGLMYEGDADNETGYSSHGSSSLQEEGSENSWKFNLLTGVQNPSNETSPSLPFADWRGNEDENMQEVNEMDDLLYHFEKFFHEKLEDHVKEFTSAMQSMFSEQQIHVRHIVNSVVSEVQLHEEEHLNDCDEGQNSTGQVMDSSAFQKHESELMYSSNVRTQLLIELLALSCELSSVLEQYKFRS